MTHTPGPWTWVPAGEIDAVWPDFDALKGENGSDVINGFGHNDSTAGVGVAKDDARLIASAPELLKALEDLMSFIPDGHGIPWNNALAAIAKAKGETR